MKQLRIAEDQLGGAIQEPESSGAYKPRKNMPISLHRDHGDVPSYAVKAIAMKLIDNPAMPEDEPARSSAVSKSVEYYLAQQAAPFQLNDTKQLPVRLQGGKEDVEMKNEQDEQAEALLPVDLKNCFYSGAFSMPEPIRSANGEDKDAQADLIKSLESQMKADK